MPTLTFFDLKSKKRFTTDKFKVMTKGNRTFAVAKSPSGGKSFRLISRSFAKKKK